MIRERRWVPPPTTDRKPSLVLHIGPHKTGTTAIQRFCDRNRDRLAKAGFWYPRSGSASAQHMLLPACHISSHRCIPAALLGGCPEEIVGSIAAEVPRGLTPLMSSEVFWELLCELPEAFDSVLALLSRYFHVHFITVERPVRERVWSAIKFNSRLGFASDQAADFKASMDADRHARERLAAIGYPVITVPYDDADCISPFLQALSSQRISRQTVRLSKLDALIEACRAASATLRENVAPSDPWFVAFTMEFAQRLLAVKEAGRHDNRIEAFLREVMAIGNQLDAIRLLPDEQTVLNRVVDAKGSRPCLLTPMEVQAWEAIWNHPAVQLAAMHSGCVDELRAVSQSPVQRRLSA
jgi:hypothetical protein